MIRGKNIDKKDFKQIHKLSKRGWLLAEIAEEMKLSEFTVNNVLSFSKFKEYEEYKEMRRILYHERDYNKNRRISRRKAVAAKC